MYRKVPKRILDFWASLIFLIVCSPLLIIVTICLHFANNGSGTLFIQDRLGLNGKVFRIIKFKTMTDERDENGKMLPDEVRLTKVGKVIRSLSLDELPQLINVLKGDMSLIGPRPLLKDYLSLYSHEQMRRHEVRPGISGWAQCHGRNAISWTEKFKLDVWYVDHCTLWKDLQVIWITIMKVLKRADISEEGQATMEPFTDNN